MTYITLHFYIFVAVVLAVYYILPLQLRWIALLCGSAGFYCWLSPEGFPVFLTTLLISYAGAIIVQRLREKYMRRAKYVLAALLCLVLLPLLVSKNGNFVLTSWLHRPAVPFIVPLGISFYTMQLVAYLVDVYEGRVQPERNLFKYALFIAFFPQIVQGPIPRYKQLRDQLVRGNRFDDQGFTKGALLILWGFFLKLMIADKTSVIVNTIFNNSDIYQGMYALIGGMLYSVQLYADFLACVTLSQGVAALFGIQLIDNFQHPYGATSVSEFWRRWHVSLSSWLRDYVYIPLGGNRHGRLIKWRNLTLTFVISGIWHGAGYRFLFWGLMHAAYQIASEITFSIRERLYTLLRMPNGDLTRRIIKTAGTYFWVTLAWIVFRANTLREGLRMIVSIFRVFNPWILFNDALFKLGLSWKECMILLGSIGILGIVSVVQQHIHVRNWVLRQHVLFRWTVYICAICLIWVFGTYGYGFSAQDFIYGGF